MQVICAVLCLLVFSDVCFGSSISRGASNHHHRRNKQKILMSENDMRQINGLKCPDCTKITCPYKLKECKGGLSKDLCECCDVCAKVENEECGGENNNLGTCDEGLYCNYTEAAIMDAQDTAFPPVVRGICRPQHDSDVPQTRSFVGKDVDKRIKFKELFTLSDDALTYPAPAKTLKSNCQPKCSPTFCKKNPRAICSAVDNADETRPCQTSCQHTSCMACRFTNSDPEACPSCTTDNFMCIKRYGRCIRKQQCWRRKFPCNAKAIFENNPGKFQCLIPECP